jgi:hypothetical protein
MCLYHLQDINKESEKGLFNTNKQKTNTRTYVNQREQGIKQLLNICNKKKHNTLFTDVYLSGFIHLFCEKIL